MSSLTVVTFETSTFGEQTYVSELSEGAPYTVHGIALGDNDVTVGQSGVKKMWPAEELEIAADTLKGTSLVVDHENGANGVVGNVTKAGHKDGTGVVYEAELYDDDLAQKVENGLLEVSIRGYHADVDSLEEDADTDAKIVEDIEFDNLSIVPTGASPSNTLEMGEHAELSEAALSAFTDSLDEAALAEIEPGMFVEDGSTKGITISQVQNGEIEVDKYEDVDGTWRAVGETMMMDTNDLSEWDVDESDVGGEVDDEDKSEEASEAAHGCLDVVANLAGDMMVPMPEDAQLLYPSEEKAMQAARMMGIEGIHEHQYEGNTWYMPGETHKSFEKVMDAQEEMASITEMMPLISEGMQFYSTVNNSTVTIEKVEGNIAHVMAGEDSRWKEQIEDIIEKLAEDDWYHAGHVEEMAADANYKRGDWVNWDTRNSTEIGTVIGGYTEGDDIPDIRGNRGLSPEGDDVLYTLRMYKERDGMYHPIEGKPIAHYERSVRSAEEPSDVSENYVELSAESILPDKDALKSMAMLASEPMIDRPTDGDRRLVFHTPVDGDMSESDMEKVVMMAESELDSRVDAEMTDTGIMFGPAPMTGTGKTEFLHEHLDVIESLVDNTVGISQKSTLFAAGPADRYSVQPCFATSEEMSEAILEEITRLYKLVTGIDADLYYVDSKLAFDTGLTELGHTALDIAEILTRRMGDEHGARVESNSFRVLPEAGMSEAGYHGNGDSEEEEEEEMGRSNAENYTDFSVDDWVQWYPSEQTEDHGKVESVSSDGESITVQRWTQTSDGSWKEGDETLTKEADDKIEPWGNFPREQDDFAIDGEDPRRAVKPSEDENADTDSLISDQVEQSLRDKAEEHNEEHGDDESKRVTYRMLKNVFNRGMGAYQDSHREGMTPQQWSYARVNAFLYLVRNGNPENDAYVQDNDLLPEEHSEYNETPDTEENAPYSYRTGDMVRWQANANMVGKVVHNPEEREIVMVEIMEEGDDGMEPTGYTLTAGPDDLIPMAKMESAAITTGDMPTESSIPTHDTGNDGYGEGTPQEVIDMMEQFFGEADLSSAQIASTKEFAEYIDGEALAHFFRGENEEPPIESKKELENSREIDPKWLESEIEEMEASMDELDEVYSDWSDSVNMTASELREWSGHPCSREASLKPEKVMRRNLELLETNKSDWDASHIADAKQTISFVARMRGVEGDEMDAGAHGCPSKRDISLLNWAYNPYNKLPDVPESEQLDDVNEVELGKLAEVKTELAMEDVPEKHMFSTREEAMDAIEDMDGITGVHEMDGMYMPGETHEDYMDKVAESGYHGNGMDEEDDEEMNASYSMMGADIHSPEFDGTTMMDWSSPDMEDFDTDDMSTLANHFLISESGFPPENFTDLKLPVVEPNGELSLPALRNAKARANQVEGLSGEELDEVMSMITEMANENFDEANFEEMSIDGTSGRPTASKTVGGVRVLSGDDLQQVTDKSGESDVDALTTYNITMNKKIESQLSELDEPVAVEAAEVEELRGKANRFEEMSENLEALRSRTDILDQVSREQVEELAEMDEPVVTESTRYEELQSEAEEVAGVYAAQLAEKYGAFSSEELMEKFSIEELRDKFEAEVGDVSEELTSSTSAQPKSQDADEESLESASETTEAELSDEVRQKQEEIRAKILD